MAALAVVADTSVVRRLASHLETSWKRVRNSAARPCPKRSSAGRHATFCQVPGVSGSAASSTGLHAEEGLLRQSSYKVRLVPSSAGLDIAARA